MTIAERVDRLDMSLFDTIEPGGTSAADRRSLLALHAAIAARGQFTHLEIGSWLGSSLQSFIADSRCRAVISIDTRDELSPDERCHESRYDNNTTANMRARLAAVPSADLQKLHTIDTSTEQLDGAEMSANLCFVDGEHTNDAVLRDARFCRRAVKDSGVIVFHDRKLVPAGIGRFLRELSRPRVYPLAHDLLVVELGVESLLSDSRVRAQVPRKAWLLADRLRLVPAVLRSTSGR